MHFLTMISGKEVTYVTRGMVIEWTYMKDRVRHWDYAVSSIAATGSLSVGHICSVSQEAHMYFKKLQEEGCTGISVTTDFPGFTEIVSETYCS